LGLGKQAGYGCFAFGEQDIGQVLASLGYDEDAIINLKVKGVVF